jgi:hypothetical protein
MDFTIGKLQLMLLNYHTFLANSEHFVNGNIAASPSG